jgi:hypothetical protein
VDVGFNIIWQTTCSNPLANIHNSSTRSFKQKAVNQTSSEQAPARRQNKNVRSEKTT